MSDEKDGVRITITVEVIENGQALPNKVVQSVLDPHNPFTGLGARATYVLPRAIASLCRELRPQLQLRDSDPDPV